MLLLFVSKVIALQNLFHSPFHQSLRQSSSGVYGSSYGENSDYWTPSGEEKVSLQ